VDKLSEASTKEITEYDQVINEKTQVLEVIKEKLQRFRVLICCFLPLRR